ncbi:MAG TPA: hypothetical protein PLI74_10325, partial [Candidatus Kapabacteria bacterium]|nr:hypothetical protein [Candidatus Kapabacteria bacterium]
MNSTIHPENEEHNLEDAAVYALGGADIGTEQEQIKKHISDAEAVLEALASAHAVNPSPSLRPRLLNKIIGGKHSFSQIITLQSKIKKYQRY